MVGHWQGSRFLKLNLNNKSMKTFELNEHMRIVCDCVNTRYGFRHDALLYEDGIFIDKAKVCYYNRTWESFEYETVISNLLHKRKSLPVGAISIFMQRCREGYVAEVNQKFNMIAGLAKMGELLSDDKKEQNDWKKRMLDAGLSGLGLDMPDNWDSLSEDDKERRLNSVITMLDKPIK
jgi:hypothetical protein